MVPLPATAEMNAAGERIDAEMRAQGFAGADPEAVYYAMLDAAPRPSAIELRDAMWLPITSAPVNYEIIYRNDDGRVSTCHWAEEDGQGFWWDTHGDQLAYPKEYLPGVRP
jgi:hypothetical protein